MSDYAPFPENELEEIACMLDDSAMGWDGNLDRSPAVHIRNAIASYKALNQRCLVAELALNHGVKEPAS